MIDSCDVTKKGCPPLITVFDFEEHTFPSQSLYSFSSSFELFILSIMQEDVYTLH